MWIGHIFRRKRLLIHTIEGKTDGRIDVTGRQARRHEQVLHDLKETRGYGKLKEETEDRTLVVNSNWKRLRNTHKTSE
jgi:hypothetical protein